MKSDFAARLLAWHKRHGRHDLPWQRTRDAYRIWVAEIMLQQTQVAAVIPYYQRFLERFPDIATLAGAPQDEALRLWSGLGYYSRARNLQRAAQLVQERHGGAFPRALDDIEALPGIGRSTAAAIAAFAYGTRAAILDGNVKRVLARHRGVDGWTGTPAVEAKLWRIAESLLPGDAPAGPAVADEPAEAIATYTQALMDLGATLCTRARPRCDACPVAGDCIALREQRVDALPSPRPRKPLPRREVRVLMLEFDGKLLLEQRPPLGIWAGLWSLPEVAVDDDVPARVVARFRAAPGPVEPLPAIDHGFTHFLLTMHPLRVPLRDWPPGAGAPGIQWFTREAAMAAALPAPIRKLLERT